MVLQGPAPKHKPGKAIQRQKCESGLARLSDHVPGHRSPPPSAVGRGGHPQAKVGWLPPPKHSALPFRQREAERLPSTPSSGEAVSAQEDSAVACDGAVRTGAGGSSAGAFRAQISLCRPPSLSGLHTNDRSII